MGFRFSDKQIIFFLLFALTGQVLFLLWDMEIIGFQSQDKHFNNQRVAGKISRLHRHLKRRPLDGLIWEKSKTDQNVFYNDSILTLNESSAEIVLENETKITLEENTLISIEPPTKKGSTDIHIQFSKGSFQARNPYQKTQIENDILRLEVQANSDIKVNQSENGTVDIQLNKGEATLTFDGEETKLNRNQILKIDAKGKDLYSISPELNWIKPPVKRHYTHQSSVELTLKWDGEADDLVIISNKGQRRIVPLVGRSLQKMIPLDIGFHRIHLQKDHRVSPSLEFQIWKSPIIHLLQPYPRDRLKFGQTKFLWTKTGEVASYLLGITENGSEKRLPAHENQHILEFESKKDLNWKIYGKDSDGFIIPPAYSYPLYIRKNPFSAPKIKKPKLVKPPRSSSWRWKDLFIRQANAQENIEVLFQWEPVVGADFYWLEISQTKDFRTPLLTLKLIEPTYLWTEAKEKINYYWRVAAGDRSERMGQFSNPVLVEYDMFVKSKPKQITPSLIPLAKQKYIKKKKKLPVLPVKKNPNVNIDSRASEKNAPIDLPTNKKSKASSKPQYTNHLGFEKLSIWWQPGYGLKKFSTNTDINADLDGLDLLSIGSEVILRWKSQSQIILELSGINSTYSPKPKEKFPFQDDVIYTKAFLNLSWKNRESPWSFGLAAELLPELDRRDFEIIALNTFVGFGPKIGYGTNFWGLEYRGNISFLTDGTKLGASSRHQLKRLSIYRSLFIGVELEAIWIKGDGKTTQIYQPYGLLGYTF